jgi:hypothetical protein
MTKKRSDGSAPTWMWLFLFGGLAAFTGAYWGLARVAKHLEWHAYIGDALAPVAALLSLLAVVAALWSVHVQREELALQRKELEENREVMKAQAEEAKKAAEAQKRLADSQERLADAQEASNRVVYGTRVAQLMAAKAGLARGVEQLEAKVAELRAETPGEQTRRQIEHYIGQVAEQQRHNAALDAELAVLVEMFDKNLVSAGSARTKPHVAEGGGGSSKS